MTGTCHPSDDDLSDMSDLPPEVVANVSHPPPSEDDHGIGRAETKAHLDKAIAEGAELLRSLRALRAAIDT
jgi:hypothetical protein